jgi:hypothetical protein
VDRCQAAVFYERHDFHAIRLQFSTYHWQRSSTAGDYIPEDARDGQVVSSFPTRASFKRLEPIRPHYVVFHMNMFIRVNRPALKHESTSIRTTKLLIRDGRLALRIWWP